MLRKLIQYETIRERAEFLAQSAANTIDKDTSAQKFWIRDATFNVQQVLYIQAITKQSRGKEMPTTEHVSLFSYEGRCCPFPPNVLPPALT